jgi:hypothetical protein
LKGRKVSLIFLWIRAKVFFIPTREKYLRPSSQAKKESMINP